jgi:putative sensor protein
VNTARLRFRAPPAPLFSPAPWMATWYLFCSLLPGVAGFVLALTALLTGAILGWLLLGLPLLAAGLAVTRAIASVERHRIRPPIPAPYRPVHMHGFRARIGERLRDPATRRDTVLLVVLWVPLFVLDTVALTLWLVSFALISLPIWYRYVPATFDNGTMAHGVAFGSFPNGPHGEGARGVFVGDLPTALLAAAVGLVLLVAAANYVIVAVARAHAGMTRALLRPTADRPASVRQVRSADAEVRVTR